MLKAGQYACVRSTSGTWYGQVHAAPKIWGGDYRIRVGGTDEIVAVPWAQVGLHSAFAMRSPLLSKESNKKIDILLGEPDLLRADACTGVMNEIMTLLGMGEGTKIKSFDHKKDPDGLYRLVVNFGSDISDKANWTFGWEHGMVFQKIGNEVVFYQAWVGNFSLEDWLMLTPRALCLASAKYAPRHPSFRPSLMDEFFIYLFELSKFWKLVLSGKPLEIFTAPVEMVFGPDCSKRVDAMTLNQAIKMGKELQYHWRYTPFKK